MIPFASLAVSRWPNGLGRKADVAGGPGWLLSFAFLDQDADFSDYTGHDRTITLLEGEGFVLEGADGSSLAVDRPHRPTAFDGGWRCRMRLLGGRCLVLNAITERAGWSHAVDVTTTPGEAGFAVLLAGAATLAGGGRMAPRDAVVLPAALSGDAAFAVARFAPRAT
jgi:environmental stress-induced protein Ves